MSELHSDDEFIINMLARWRGNIDTFHNKFKVSFESTKKWLRNLLLNMPDKILFLVVNSDGEFVGHLGFANSMNTNLSMELDNVVRGEKFVSPGIMHNATKTLLNWAVKEFSPLNFHLKTLDNNINAISFYKKLGFSEFNKEPLRLIRTEDGYYYESIKDDNIEPPDRYFVSMQLKPHSNPTL